MEFRSKKMAQQTSPNALANRSNQNFRTTLCFDTRLFKDKPITVSFIWSKGRKRPKKSRRELLTMRSTDNRLEQEATKEERELELRKQALQSDIDKKIGFITSGGFTGKVGEDESGGKHAEPKDLIEGFQYRLDSNDLLLESFPERLLRLEKKWITERMSNISGGVEKEDEDENNQRLSDITDKIRRVKLKLDQEAIHQARDILFEEHSKISMKELLNERVPIERLLNYYSLPVDQRQPGINEDLEFTTVKSTVRRKEVVEDLVPGFDVDARTQLKPEDSVELRKIAQTKLNYEKVLKRTEVKESQEATTAERIETAVNERKPTKGNQSKEGGQAAKAEVVGIIRRRLLGLSEQEGPVDKTMRNTQRVSTFMTKQELRKAKREKKATPGIDKKGSVDKKK
jgi:hypothetical protein